MRSLICALVCLFCTNSFLNAKTDILWDTYGVPHIFAPNREAMFYAHGWAQMRNQANLLLLLYGQSRGRAAEYWGPEYLSLDG
jgi:acyl-homoserine-lactone acylase